MDFHDLAKRLAIMANPPPVRSQLYPSEQAYFKSNPNVAGMAADDNRVILNPYSGRSQGERNSVANNETFRLMLRERGLSPNFAVTPEQAAFFNGSSYANNPGAMRETIAARLYSSDPSIKPTNEQKEWLTQFLGSRKR